jgi:hypothetical protein
MSRANIHPQQTERGSTSPELRKEQVANIQIEIGRAFEVASAIEKAIRVAGGEGLRQFLARLGPYRTKSIRGCPRMNPKAPSGTLV